MTFVVDLNELLRLSPEAIPAWFDGRRFEMPVHWWYGVFGALETRFSPFWPQSRQELVQTMRIGAECVEVAAQRDDVPFTFVGYWVIRLSHATLRYEPPLTEVSMLTPEGAVAWFLDGLPYSTSKVLEAARTLSAADAVADEFSLDPPIDPRRHVLADLRGGLETAEPLLAHIADEDVKRRLVTWLEVKEEIFGLPR